MPKLLKKLATLILIISLNTNLAFAETVTNDEKQAKNRSEVTKFIDSLVDLKMWQDSWKDYFTNYCQRTEIFRLRRELNELRADITDSVFEELNVNVDEMIHEYYKANAQLYFLRHFVLTIQNPPLNKNEASYQITPRDKLEKDMYNYFVLEKGYITSSEMAEYIDYFYSRYDTSYYANCMDPTIDGIKKKLESIKDKFKNLSFENLKEDLELDEPINSSAKPLADSPNTKTLSFNKTTLKDSPNIKDFLQNRLGIRLHNVESLWDPAKIFKDIMYGDTNVDTSGNKNPKKPEEIGLTNIVKTANEDQKRYQFDIDIEKRLTKYEVKYKEINDAAIARYSSLLNELNTVINNSIPSLNQTSKCLENTLDKQCSE